MADLVAFSELPLQLVFKVRQLKIHLPNDTVNQVLTDVLNELALYLELYINRAQGGRRISPCVSENRLCQILHRALKGNKSYPRIRCG